jgi:hypothetical protein
MYNEEYYWLFDEDFKETNDCLRLYIIYPTNLA